MPSFTHRVIELLTAQQVARQEELERLAAEAPKQEKHFLRLLVERGLISEAKLEEVLSKELGLPVIALSKYRVDPAVATLIPERLARRYTLCALSKFGNRLVVAMADPLNICALDDLKAFTQGDVDVVLSSEIEIQRAIEHVYAGSVPAEEPATTTSAREEDASEESFDSAVAVLLNERGENEAPVVRVINRMVVEAMRRHASDIHLEPQHETLRVRYRMDGRLTEVHRIPKAVQSPILTRLKIMAGIDITEWRLPQDGRFTVRLQDHEVDFRVSVLPITHGGKVVLRLLDRTNLSIGLDHLGFLPDSIAQFTAAVKRPNGMLLVTGPTGSGKSTTLYSILNALNHPTKNLITIEDPVEYHLEGITQVQVNPEIGLTFAGGLRSLLRQSPDVVMIGEIRDFETADIAMKASLTGQLVLSTLHTNDAPSAVTRLVDMGVEPFLVASSVTLIEAQRLVRKLCVKCREPYEPPASVLKQLEWTPSPGDTFFKAVGCRLCNHTGYRGRLGMIEAFQVDEPIRERIVARVPSWEIKADAVKRLGMVPLRQDGVRKAAMGLTTLEEVLTVTAEE